MYVLTCTCTCMYVDTMHPCIAVTEQRPTIYNNTCIFTLGRMLYVLVYNRIHALVLSLHLGKDVQFNPPFQQYFVLCVYHTK